MPACQIFFIDILSLFYTMPNMDLKELDALAKKQSEKRKKILRDKYHLAKSLGFSADEAVILQKRPVELIHELARKKTQKERN